MLRRRTLVASFILATVLVTLAFPAGGSALNAVGVSLTSSGPSPAVLSIPAGLYPVWFNNDTVTHTVVFGNGLCTLQVVPGGIGQCAGVAFSVGAHPYTVDGAAQASVTVTPERRSVTLRAARHAIRRGGRLTLRGVLRYDVAGPPVVGTGRPSMRVTVLARPDRRHRFRAVATVRPRAGNQGSYPWLRHIRPRRTTTYIVEANSQPASGQYWQPAHSGPFTVVVRR